MLFSNLGKFCALDGVAPLRTFGAGGTLPSRLLIAPWGEHLTPKGRIVVGNRTLSQLAGNQRITQFERVALDFNHNTVPGAEAYQGEPAKVAAHGTPRILAGEGIVLENLEWTQEGKDFVGGGHYIDLSPTVLTDGNDEIVFLHSAAVCRQGCIPNLTLFSADAIVKNGKFLFQAAGDPVALSKDTLVSLASTQSRHSAEEDREAGVFRKMGLTMQDVKKWEK